MRRLLVPMPSGSVVPLVAVERLMTMRPRWATGPLAVVAFVFSLLFFAAPAHARAPEPGDKVKITLHDGNNVVGELLGLSESGYRVSFGGMEVIVAYPSVKGIEILVEDSLLEEMRPRQGNDPRGQSEPTFGQPAPPPRASPPAPPPASPPPTSPRYQRSPQYAPPPPPSSDPTPPRGYVAPRQAAPSPNYEQEQDGNNLDVPPKPRSRGGGLMVSGFILMGVGAGLAVGSAVAYEGSRFDSEASFLPVITGVGGIMAVAGTVMGVTGIILKSVSGSRRRRWERKYGGEFSLRPESLVVVPTFSPQGDGGLALVATF